MSSKSKRCAFLTMEGRDGYVFDDELMEQPMAELGWSFEQVPWRQPGVNWQGYDLVVIRSTWDYQHAPEDFLAVLAEIESRGVPLENRLELVRWNYRKTYLRELEARGLAVVPTFWGDSLGVGQLPLIADQLSAEEIVIKPVVGASAGDTFHLPARPDDATLRRIESLYTDRAFMVQPFVRRIVEEGEFSLFFFAGELSHTVLKTPKERDFRVQEEFGSRIQLVQPENGLVRQARRVLGVLDTVPLYARVDLVRGQGEIEPVDQSWILMELELIEPSLYLHQSSEAPQRFARAIDNRASKRLMQPSLTST